MKLSWRRKNSGCGRSRKSEEGDDVGNARKVSIDHTMLSGSEHTSLVASGDFLRSLDADIHGVEIYPTPNFAHDGPYASEEHHRIVHDTAPCNNNTVKASRSDPSLLAHNLDGYCQHQTCSPTDTISHSQRSANSHQPLQPPMQLPNSHPPASPKLQDSFLRARIEAIRIQQQLLGDNHPDVIFALTSLAKLHQRRGNHAEAASILREAKMRGTMANPAPQSSFLGRRSPQFGQGGTGTNVPTEISFPH